MASLFCSAMWSHLGHYKRDVLNVTEDGIRNGRVYEHVLPPEFRDLNILPSIRESFWRWFEQHHTVKALHKDFRHLTNSQAMAFNLFYPAIAKLDGGALLKVLGIDGEVAEFSLEKIRHPAEETNLDCYIRLKDGQQFFCEVKFTEPKFGKAEPNPRRLKKLAEIYRGELCRLVKESCLEEGFFFEHHQLLRNIYHLHENPADQLFLIFPRANNELEDTADRLKQHVIADVQPRIHIRHVEDLISEVKKLSAHPVWQEFEGKYLPDGEKTAALNRDKMGRPYITSRSLKH